MSKQDVDQKGPVGVDALIEAMFSRPLDFVQGEFDLTDKKTGLEIWTANGWGFYHVQKPGRISFTLWEQFRFGRALRRWHQLWLAHKLATSA